MGNSNRNRVSQQQAIAERDRSYDVRDAIEVGSVVRFTRDCYHGQQIRKGQRGTVTHYSNAGFQGILASVKLTDGTTVYGVGAGTLEAAPRRMTKAERYLTATFTDTERRAYA